MDMREFIYLQQTKNICHNLLKLKLIFPKLALKNFDILLKRDPKPNCWLPTPQKWWTELLVNKFN